MFLQARWEVLTGHRASFLQPRLLFRALTRQRPALRAMKRTEPPRRWRLALATQIGIGIPNHRPALIHGRQLTNPHKINWTPLERGLLQEARSLCQASREIKGDPKHTVEVVMNSRDPSSSWKSHGEPHQSTGRRIFHCCQYT